MIRTHAPRRLAAVVLGLVLLLVCRSAPAQSRGGAGERSPIDAPAVFEELIGLVEREHAYAHLRGLDLRVEAAREIERLGDQPGLRDGLLAAQRFVARLGDGHARVGGWRDAVPEGAGRLSCLLGEAEGGVVATKRDRTGFVDGDHPFVESIDGRPIEDWISAASAYVAAGSRQLVRRRSIELIWYVPLIRQDLRLPSSPAVEVGLRSADGRSRRAISLPLSKDRAAEDVWPRRESGVLPSGFGYLRIEEMSLESGAGGSGVRQRLEPLMNTPGLIIDGRGNGGGSRDVVSFLLPRLMNPGEARVVTVAAKRIPSVVNPSHPDGYLQDRAMYPVAWKGWSDAQREAILRTAAGWSPEWTPPGGWAGRFSDWHYFVVSAGDDTGPHATPRYKGPVVVLMDDACFSATDILLGGLKGMDRVTLVGLPSSGGSANAEDYRLGALGLGTSVRLATMASFKPDGSLYDGRGVEPDVIAPRRATDLIDRTDSQLDAAEALLRQKLGQGR
jgi:Peptidase family S41